MVNGGVRAGYIVASSWFEVLGMPARADCLIAILSATVVLPSPLRSQIDTTASIRGTAISSFDGRPLSGVLIGVPAARTFVVTDSTGSFFLASLPVGEQKIRISYDGRVTEEYEFTLFRRGTKRIAVLLDADAEDLAPVVVEVRPIDQWRDLGGFFARQKSYAGFARFFTREEIAGSHVPHISNLLALERIVTQCGQGCRPTRVSRGRLCVVPVSVDGLPMQEEEYDRIKVTDVAAVEVYRGNPPYGLTHATPLGPAASVWQGESVNSRGSCGSVLIWTR
jgi:hypothetical protein